MPRLAYSIAEAAAVTSLSRATLYRLISSGKLRTVTVGARRLIPATEIQRLCGLSLSETDDV